MYHRIIYPDKTIQSGMYVKPDTFEKHLQYLKKNFHALSITDLKNLHVERIDFPTTKATCILTFDDGWKDFFEFAFPLLKKHHLPAVVFLPTNFIDTANKFWSDRFAHILLHRKKCTEKIFDDLSELVCRLVNLTGVYEKQLEAGLCLLKNYPVKTIMNTIDTLSKLWGVSDLKYDRDFLTWEEISEMHKSGLISFGSHTVNHHILTTINHEIISSELVDSREELINRQVMDSSCSTFCYPNGNFTETIADLVQTSGYHLAVTTTPGWNNLESDRFTLKRIGIHQDMASTVQMFACRIAGFI